MAQRFNLAPIGNVYDQRVVGGAAFCGKNGMYRLTVQRISAKTVDCFGGKADHLPCFDQFGTKLQALFVG